MSGLVEFHGWRGFRVEQDLFLVWIRLGFVTFGVSRVLVTERLRELTKKLRELGLPKA